MRFVGFMEKEKANIKVLHLFNNYLPPSQVWAYQLLKHATETEIHIAARHYHKQNFYYPGFQFVPNVFDTLDQYKKELSKKGISNWAKQSIIKSLPYLLGSFDRRLIQYIQNNNIQILHAHFAPVAWSYYKLVRRSGIPLIISFYGYDYEYFPNFKPVFNQHYQDLFATAALVLCEGDHGRKILEGKGCPSDKIRVTKLGIELNEHQYQERLKKPKELRLIQMASFTGKKGHIYTLKAFHEALKTCPNLSLTLVGNVKDENVKMQVDDFIQKNDLSATVELKEFLPYAEVMNELYRHHVFIHPSCYTEDLDCEGGAPIVLLDAQATGMPVISTTHCDIPQEVLHKQTGWLVAEKDVSALCQAIVHFYHMGEREFKRYGQRARKHVMEYYNIEENAKVLESIYAELA